MSNYDLINGFVLEFGPDLEVVTYLRSMLEEKDREHEVLVNTIMDQNKRKKLEIIESVPCSNIIFNTGGILNNVAHTQTKEIEKWKRKQKQLINKL